MKNLKTFLPVFNGFYGTFFESIIEDSENREIEFYNEDNETALNWCDFIFDYDKIKKEISLKCCEEIENKLNEIGIICEITYQDLISPKFYNFSNDSINIEINFKDFNQVIKILEDSIEIFTAYIRDRYTSRSGFISNHSNYASDWIEDLKNDPEGETHKVGAVLEFILIELEQYNDYNLYNDVTEWHDFTIDYELTEN